MKTYYIYHIPGVKIGCTTKPEHRVNRQGYTEYEILEKHTCIDTASKRELELQEQYGYGVDKVPYKQTCLVSKKGYSKGGRVAGKFMYENGIGLFNGTKEELAERSRINGRKASKAVIQYDLNNNIIKEYNSQTEASKITGLRQSGISICCLGKQKTYAGYKWKYKD